LSIFILLLQILLYNNGKILLDLNPSGAGNMGEEKIKFEIKALTTGLKNIETVSDKNEKLSFILLVLYQGSLKPFGDIEEIIVTNTDAYQFSYVDFNVSRTINSNDDFSIGNLSNIKNISFDAKNSSNNVTCTNIGESSISINMPLNEEVIISFNVRCVPRVISLESLNIVSAETGASYTHNYNVLPKINYHVSFKSDVFVVEKSLLTTKCKSGHYIYPLGCSEKSFIAESSHLRYYLLHETQYIGPLNLKLSHLEATLEYNDTLLETISKNNTYIGKKGAMTENLPLILLVPLEDAYTIKGLAGLDKPLPINTNIRAKKSDVLNHKGCGVLYSISVERANMNWYKVTGKIAYLTKNLHARFIINRGSKISDYFLPDNLLRIINYGSALTDNFYISTTGGYSYTPDPTGNIHAYNNFNLDNKQYFSFKSKEFLNIKSRVCFNWFSTHNPRGGNNLSPVIQILDSDDEPVFEYEYYDIIFDIPDLIYNARVIGRAKYKDGWKVVINKPIRLNFIATYVPLDDDSIQMYGSEVIFTLISDKLTILDKGFSEKEIFVENIDIDNSLYSYRVEFRNNNDENNDASILNYVDIELDGLKNSFDDNTYENLLVAPFPIPEKKIMFTREAEDDTLFMLMMILLSIVSCYHHISFIRIVLIY